MKKHLLSCLAISGMILSAIPATAQITVFSDNFDGAAVDLHDTTPDTTTGGAKWVATPVNFLANGSITGGTGSTDGAGSATLAFTPFNGRVYTLDASFTGISGGTNNWIAFGFAKGQGTGASTSGANTNRFTTTQTIGKAWMFARSFNDLVADPNNTNNTYLGTTTGGVAGVVAWDGPLADADGGDFDMRIVLDTTGGTGSWTATWYAKRPADGSYTLIRATEELTDEDITSVGYAKSNFSVFATIESFSLTYTDSVAPSLVSTNPANATQVAVSADLNATFSEPVFAGTGSIELRGPGDSLVEEFDVESEVTFSGQSFTINPTADLTSGDTYHILIPSTAVRDQAGNFYAGIANSSVWSFTGASAVNATWTGTTSGAWLTDTNWMDSVIPGSSSNTTNTDAALFDVAAQPTVGINMNTTAGNYYLGGIDYNNATARNIGNSSSATAGVLTLNGSTLNSVANTIIWHRTTTALTIQATQSGGGTMGLALGNATDNIIQITGSANVVINSIISGAGKKLTLQGGGTGVLSLTGANTYSGGTYINAGFASLGNITAAGTGTIHLGATSGSDAAELRLNGTGTNPTNDLIVRTGSSGTKSLANRGSNTVSYAGIITANDNLTVFAANSGGRLTTSGSGNTIANGKTVSFSNTGTANNAMTNSATWGGQGSISYTSNSGMGFTVSGANTYSGGTTLGAMSGTGILIPTVSSTGPANAPDNGPFGTGTLSIGATKMRGGTTTPLTIGNAITFIDNPTFTTVASEKSIIFTGDATLGDTRTLTVEIGSTVATEEVEFSGQISGTGFGIIKEGAGNLLLSGTNTYTGDTTVNAGVLAITGSSIDNSAKLAINGSGKVDLTNTETVAALDFDGNPQPAGTYSASSVPPTATITTASFSGSGTLTVGAPSDPYTVWSGGAAFEIDSNNDGVKNGLAWLLGAPDKDTNALDLLPKVSQSGGGLVMKFTCLKLAGRGTNTLSLQHSGDLGLTDPWVSVAVPDTATTVGTVVFTVPTTNADPNLVDLEATIPVGEALNGKLFGRLIAATP